MAIRATPALPLRMTEAEFDTWCFGVDARTEFVDGEVIILSPVSREHNHIDHFLIRFLGAYLEEGPGGELLGPEFLIRLRAGLRRVPDLLYLVPERVHLLRDTYLDGSPDAAWEIVSPDSEERDWHDKYKDYQEAGVREYWIIDPAQERVALFRLDAEASYEPVPEEEGRLTSQVVQGFWLKPEWLWQNPMPKVLGCLREMGVLP